MKMQEVSLTELKKLIEVARKMKPAGTIYVEGRAGIGKSTLIKSLEDSGWQVFELRAVYLDIGDLITRIPDIERKKLIKVYEELFDRIVEAEKKGKKTVLLLDEFRQAEKHVLRMFYQLIFDREIEGKKVPEETVIIAVSNTDEDAEDLTEVIQEKPLWDRFVFRVKVYADFEEWREWAFDNNIDRMIVAFLSRFNEYFYYEEEGVLVTTPRRWEMLNKVVRIGGYDLQLVTAVLGEFIGSRFVSFVKLSEKFRIDVLVKEGLKGLTDDEKYAVLPLIASEIAKSVESIDRFMEIVADDILGDMKVLLLRFVAMEYARQKGVKVQEAKLELLAKSKMFKKYIDEVAEMLGGD